MLSDQDENLSSLVFSPYKEKVLREAYESSLLLKASSDPAKRPSGLNSESNRLKISSCKIGIESNESKTDNKQGSSEEEKKSSMQESSAQNSSKQKK